MARSVSSWLSGPEPADSVDNTYPGQALGLPQTGPRSLARTGRRLAALCVDWLMCYGVAALLMSLGLIPQAMLSTAVLAVWFVVGAVSVLGNVSLALFLALALMSMRLWELSSLALPMLVLLLGQTALMAAYAIFVTFPVMGRNYDAAVIAAGHCGFGLGATPTAIANMQAVTDRFGNSPLAFLVVPMVGAFFIDLANALVIKLFLMLPLY